MTEDTPKLCINCAHCAIPASDGLRSNGNFYDCNRVTDVVTGRRGASDCRRERDYPAIGVPGYCGREGKYWTPKVKP